MKGVPHGGNSQITDVAWGQLAALCNVPRTWVGEQLQREKQVVGGRAQEPHRAVESQGQQGEMCRGMRGGSYVSRAIRH